MNPAPFEYHAPTTVAQAASLMMEFGEDSRILAGGQSLVPLMKLRFLSPGHIIDIGKIPGLNYIRDDSVLRIGSMTRHREISTAPIIKQKYGILSEAAMNVGDPQIRNQGTIGGTICHADPSADIPATLVALDAQFELTSPSTSRTVDSRDFFHDVFETDLAQNEILTEIRIANLPDRSGGSYMKFRRAAGDFAIVGVAAIICPNDAGECRDVRIGLAGVAPTPLRATKAELFLKGKKPNKAVLVETAGKSAEDFNPTSYIRGSAEYKREMVKVFVRRAIEESMRRSPGWKK